MSGAEMSPGSLGSSTPKLVSLLPQRSIHSLPATGTIYKTPPEKGEGQLMRYCVHSYVSSLSWNNSSSLLSDSWAMFPSTGKT